MKKRNLIIQAAVAGLFSAGAISAYATGTGSANGNTAQLAQQAVTTSSLIGTGSIQYVETAAIPVGNYEAYVQLGNGAKFKQAAAGAIAAGALVVAAPTGTIAVSGPGTVSNDQTFVVFPISVTAGVPANTTTFTFKPLGVASKTQGGVTNVVASAGVSLTATMSIGSSASLSLATPQADEGTPSTAPIVTFVNGITDGALSSGLFTGAGTPLPYLTAVGAETATIDVVASAGLKLITNVNVAAATGSELLDLGGFYFADVNATHTAAPATPPFGADAATGFNIDTDYVGATSTASITAPAGFFNVATAKGATTTGQVYLSSDAGCAIANKIAAAAATISADGSTVSFSAIPVTAAAAGAGVFSAQTTGSAVAFVCVQAAVPNAITWEAGQTYVTATLNPPAASTVAPVTLAKTALYNLTTNGGSAYVRSYIPAANGTSASSYQSFIRVINTGAVTANISAAIVSDTTGATGVSGVFATAVPPGGAVTVPSSTIEHAIVAAGGVAPAAASRPRLYVTAPTTIAVQSFFLSPNGDFNEVSSGNNGAANDNQ